MMTLDPMSIAPMPSLKKRMAAFSLAPEQEATTVDINVSRISSDRGGARFGSPCTATFPEIGVSGAFLRRIRGDARFRRPLADLPLVVEGKLAVPPGVVALDARDATELRVLARLYRAFSHLDGEAEHAVYAGVFSGAFKGCDRRHPLEAVHVEDRDEDKEDAGSVYYTCDICAASIPTGVTRHGCRECGFDLCGACHSARAHINGREELLAALRKPPTTTTQVTLVIVKPDTLAAGKSYGQMLLDQGGDEAFLARV